MDAAGIILLVLFCVVSGITLWSSRVKDEDVRQPLKSEDEPESEQSPDISEPTDESLNFPKPQQRSFSASSGVRIGGQGLQKFGGGGSCASATYTVRDQFGNDLADGSIPSGTHADIELDIEQTCSKLINGAVTEGAGTPEANGTWVWNEDTGQYENENGAIVENDGLGFWFIIIDNLRMYAAPITGEPIWSLTWIVGPGGQAPAPSFSQLTEPCTVTPIIGGESFGPYEADTTPEIEVVDSTDAAVTITKVSNSKIQIPSLPCAPAMTVDFEADITESNVGDEITFTDQTTGTPVKWCWDVNGNQFSTNQNPTLIPLFAGDLTIQLLAGGDNSTGGFEEKVGYLAIGGLLDKVSGGIGIAPFRLHKAYTGAIMRVRPDGGGPTDEVDIAQNSNGQLDEDALLAVGDDVKVFDYYDQNGGANWVDGHAPYIVIDGEIQRIWNRPAMSFNGSTHWLRRPSANFWDGYDRTKLFICVVVKPAASASATNVILAHLDATSNQRAWALIRNGTNNTLFFRYSISGTSTYQDMVFSSLEANEQAVISVAVDTTEAADDRVKMWKNGVELSGSRSGDLTGAIHDSTADFTLGCYTPSSPVGFYPGLIGMPLLFPFLPTEQEQADIAACAEAIFKAP